MSLQRHKYKKKKRTL